MGVPSPLLDAVRTLWTTNDDLESSMLIDALYVYIESSLKSSEDEFQVVVCAS